MDERGAEERGGGDARRVLRRALAIAALLFALTVAAVALVAWWAGAPDDAPFEYDVGRQGKPAAVPRGTG